MVYYVCPNCYTEVDAAAHIITVKAIQVTTEEDVTHHDLRILECSCGTSSVMSLDTKSLSFTIKREEQF